MVDAHLHAMKPGDPPSALLDEQRLVLKKAVAWLNANRHRDDSHVIERWLEQQFAILDEADRLFAQRGPTPARADEWLETAGSVGGPEVDQDPTRPHPRAWHGETEARNGENR
jgi:hypothetical protein